MSMYYSLTSIPHPKFNYNVRDGMMYILRIPHLNPNRKLKYMTNKLCTKFRIFIMVNPDKKSFYLIRGTEVTTVIYSKFVECF